MMDIKGWKPFKDEAFLKQTLDHTNFAIVKVDLPRVKIEGIGISITGDVITIETSPDEHVAEEEVNFKNCYSIGNHHRKFRHIIVVPIHEQSDKAVATFENDLLTLTLPRASEINPKRVKVKPRVTVGRIKR